MAKASKTRRAAKTPGTVDTLSLLKLSRNNRVIVSRIVGRMPEKVRTEWQKKLIVKDGHVAGTYYKRAGDTLSFNDFVALYKALGYPFPLNWQDYMCTSWGCKSVTGFSCDPDSCTGSSN